MRKEFVVTHSNIYVVPVICVEYFLVWTFYNRGWLFFESDTLLFLKNYLLDSPDYTKLQERLKKVSLEKLYKKFFVKDLGLKVPSCMVNRHPDEELGVFT